MRDLCIYDEVTYVDGPNLVKGWVIDILSYVSDVSDVDVSDVSNVSDVSVQVEDADGNRTWVKKSDIRKVRD